MANHQQTDLFREKRFFPYFATQFLGAFNDNVYKNALIIFIAYHSTQLAIDSNTLINASAGLFILPFFLFSALAGQLGEKLEKSRLIRLIKLLEIGIMLLAALGFYLGNLYFLIAVLFLMGTQSTLFGPVKYSYLPQHLNKQELTGGNGLVEMGTFLAILLGTILGGLLIALEYGSLIVSLVILFFAGLGYMSSRYIPHTPASAPDLKISWNLFQQTWYLIELTREKDSVFKSILAISWFWLLGGVYLAQIPNYTLIYLQGDAQVVTILLTCFSLGIGIGSILCERLSGQKTEIGLVPFGALGMLIFGLHLSIASVPALHSGDDLRNALEFFWYTDDSWFIMSDFIGIGLFGGLFIVPLYTLVQQRSKPQHLARIMAGNNILNALFMVSAALFSILLLASGLTIPQLFFTVIIMHAAVSLYIFSLVPEFLMRFLVWLLIHSVYRVQIHGLDKIPEHGAVVLTSNHVSYFDPLIIAGCVRRPVRFVMYYKIFQIPVLNFIFRTAGAIPIAGAKEDPEILAAAWVKIQQVLDAGEVLCIFPEGGLSKNGDMKTFRPGIERILDDNSKKGGASVPVVPMALCGLWGTFFSREGGSAMSGLPTRLWSKIALKIADPIPAEQVTAQILQDKTQNLRGSWQ
jgi:1-acyl-sn-glycerol-3-phosphate acyltransferase